MNIYVIPQGWHKQPMLVSLDARLALDAHYHNDHAHEYDVASTQLFTFRQRRISVSTVLLPVAFDARIKWETMVFSPYTAMDCAQWFWYSRAKAVRGHRWALRHISLMLALMYGDSIVKIDHWPKAIESGSTWVWRQYGVPSVQGSEPQEVQRGDLV